ncbi:hypothetical protein [Thauera sinica]|uniref:Uncharacterized protein n=1 Tax=Thauera sinica TaxID=2665146 RepID=A0ABW1AU63_9RHOO|nr:hypothetical protein [Thauera sp. K11]
MKNTYESPCVKIAELKTGQADWTPAIPSMQKQSELLLSWAIAIVGGIVALITTKNLHHFKMIRFLYLILAPALSLIAGSIWIAVEFQSRSSYLLLNKCSDFEGTLNKLLLVQTDLFKFSLAALVLFAIICLIQLTLGYVKFGANKS